MVAGKWFAPGAQEISVEEGIAKTLGWKMGDELTFTVGGESFTARITSLRKLRWDSMKVNFFVIGPPALVGRFPASYISAFRLAPGDEPLMNELTARFPNLTVVDVGAAVRQAQGVVDQVITAVQVVFLFALGAGLLVLYSALVATEDERRREAAVMRVYGASRAQVTGSQRVEFLAMGLLAGAARHRRRRRHRPAARAARVRARPAAQPRSSGSPGRSPACCCSRSTPGCRRARCCRLRPR